MEEVQLRAPIGEVALAFSATAPLHTMLRQTIGGANDDAVKLEAQSARRQDSERLHPREENDEELRHASPRADAPDRHGAARPSFTKTGSRFRAASFYSIGLVSFAFASARLIHLSTKPLRALIRGWLVRRLRRLLS
jgi:hypothetical protein